MFLHFVLEHIANYFGDIVAWVTRESKKERERKCPGDGKNVIKYKVQRTRKTDNNDNNDNNRIEDKKCEYTNEEK